MNAQTIIPLIVAALGALAALFQYLGKTKLAAEATAAKTTLDDHKDQLDALVGTVTAIVKGVEASKGKIDDQTMQLILAQIKEHAPTLVDNQALVKSVVTAISTGQGDVRAILGSGAPKLQRKILR